MKPLFRTSSAGWQRSCDVLIQVVFFSLVVPFVIASAQPQYRTFTQTELAEKKANAGKDIASRVCFTFKNSTDVSAQSLHATLNSSIISIADSGGYSSIVIDSKKKTFNATGLSVAVGDSVTLCFVVAKKAPGTHVNFWSWDTNGVSLDPRNGTLTAVSDVQILQQPNGGNIFELLYKKVLRRPAGLVVGAESTANAGWIRYMTADRKFFPHTGTPRCLDSINTGPNRKKIFLGQLKNPHVSKHDNHLLGELHALKLAIIANDSGVTEPQDLGANLFGQLLYNDTVNGGDPCNGLTIREIVHLADSAISNCSEFTSGQYADLDNCISRLNNAFDGPYQAITFSPFLLAGTRSLDDVYFLHPNPSAIPSVRPTGARYTLVDDAPERFEVNQNYPNPFNPQTTIDFRLSEPSNVTLKIYNILGEEVMTVLDEAGMDEGEQTVDVSASSLPSGVYVYRLSALGSGADHRIYNSVKKMILMK